MRKPQWFIDDVERKQFGMEKGDLITRVVMCEECEHSYYSEGRCSLMCGLHGHKTGKADYCSKGERHDA